VVKIEDLYRALVETWEDINRSLKNRSLEHLRKLTTIVTECTPREEIKGLIVAPWDGTREDAELLEKNFGKSVLGEIVESPIELPNPSNYVTCSGRRAEKWALLGVTY
jgi:prolyl-tRNA synthetase